MTREELFRAVGEVREDQIEAAETVKKQSRPWRRIGALAACLAFVVTAAAVSWPKGQPQWGAVIYSFNPGAETDAGGDAGGGASAGGMDGTHYWTDSPTRETHPDYSKGVEIGELDGPGNGSGIMNAASCLAWLAPEEIFAQDTVIFRGRVEELQYFRVEWDSFPIETYFTRALVRVTDIIRGDLEEGEVYAVGYMGAKGYASTSISGPLEDLDVGGDAIFMPIRTDADTGWKEGDSYFCYADLVEYYLSEGMRFVFADTAGGLDFERSAYEEIADAETLDEVAAYIRGKIGIMGNGTIGTIPEEMEPEFNWLEDGPAGASGAREGTQRAAIPAEPQPEPAHTEPSEGPAGAGEVPNGARELPGGAYIGDEKPDNSP